MKAVICGQTTIRLPGEPVKSSGRQTDCKKLNLFVVIEHCYFGGVLVVIVYIKLRYK